MYPYSHATTIEGPIEGMEYPMLTFVPNSPTREDQQWALAHEFGHEWFPMIVGSNERLYPWMDEGFNTFIDLANAASYFTGRRTATRSKSTRCISTPSTRCPATSSRSSRIRPRCAICSGAATRSRRS